MNKYYIYGLIAFSAVAFASCSDDEEILEPSSNYVDNKFAVPADATGPEADMRRAFYNTHGTYLMFDDNLGRSISGYTATGEPIWIDEKIDFLYNLTDYGLDAPKLTFIETMEEKEQAVAFLEERVMPRIAGGGLAPFSILPVTNIQTYRKKPTGRGYAWQDAYTVSCWRCLAISTREWLDADNDEDKRMIEGAIMKDLLSVRFTVDNAAAEEFLAVSKEYYYEDLYDIIDEWDEDEPDMTLVYNLGFLSYDDYWNCAPSDKDDFNEFFDILFDMEENEFMETYGDYPLIVRKYNLMKEALIALGFKFEF